jgi:hypothetical protein
VYTISTGLSACSAICWATCAIRTGLPISSTSASPSRPIAAAWMTSWTASCTVMKYRLTSGSVTVIGPPAATCAANAVSTEPRLPSTLPNRTLRYVPSAVVLACAVSRSVIRLV